MNDQIKVGFCVAYDWPLLEISIPLIYHSADAIYLTIDNKRAGWSGKEYPFDEPGFLRLIKNLDTGKKITIEEDDFHVPTLSPMENEVRQRNIMANFMGKGGWHIQLDCDEYFLNFGLFTSLLKGLKLIKKDFTNICCPFITLFKKNDAGYFIIANSVKEALDFVPVACSNPNYEYGRRNGYFNYHTSCIILHESWAHTPEEVARKLDNWGHRNDFDGQRYFTFWDSVNENTFSAAKNFHPINPENWPGLKYHPVKNISELIKYYQSHPVRINPISLVLKNSRLFSKVKSIISI
jgi:hypothetical protein